MEEGALVRIGGCVPEGGCAYGGGVPGRGCASEGWGRTGRRAEACADVGMREEWRRLGFEEGQAVEQVEAEEELACERIVACTYL